MSRGSTSILLILAMSLPGAARAVGLGEIRINSALNEPLSASIDIIGATREELAALTASVANRETFKRYGADRPAFLSSATFKIGIDDQGHPVLNVRSAEPFSDPLVSLLVDLRWGTSELIREYSLLLDPPGYGAAYSPNVQLAASPAAPLPATVTPTPTTERLQRVPERLAAVSDTPVNSTQHRVTEGESLRLVARQAGARSEPQLQRMMIAIFHANPRAFFGNINRLRRDVVLSIPSDSELAAISATDAKREVQAHMTSWRMNDRLSATRAATPAANVTAVAAQGPNSARLATTLVQQAAIVDPDASLKARVQSLEQHLNDLNTQLDSENAKIQGLKDTAVHANRAAAGTSPAADLVQLPIIATANADSVFSTTAALPKTTSSSLWAPLAAALALFAGALAYLRSRRRLATQPLAVTEFVAPAFLTAAATTPRAANRATVPVSAPSNQPAAYTATHIEAVNTDNTIGLDIDIEALERSYSDSEYVQDSAVIDSKDITADKDLRPALDKSTSDVDILDLDGTAQHVQMPSELHNPAAYVERRTNIIDVLKSAIDRDPQRRDLRMKLLETYYSVAETNQRAFVDGVRKLSCERELLSAEDWNFVMQMGRQIASDDILFADVAEDSAILAHCA